MQPAPQMFSRNRDAPMMCVLCENPHAPEVLESKKAGSVEHDRHFLNPKGLLVFKEARPQGFEPQTF